MDIKQTVRSAEAARRLGVSRARIAQLIEAGRLDTVEDDGGETAIPLSEIRRRKRELGQSGRNKKPSHRLVRRR